MSAQIDCPVCLNAITGLVNCATTLCGHKFHTSCLMKCVSHSGFNCPYCRSNMDEEEEEPVPETEPESEEEDEPAEEEQPVVKMERFNGVKYLIDKRGGVVYSYELYMRNQAVVEVGRWIEATKQVELFV